MTNLLHLTIAEQSELRGIARRFGQAEMAEGMRRDQTATRRALQKPALDQIRLDDVFDRVARLGQRGGQRFDADRSASVVDGDGR